MTRNGRTGMDDATDETFFRHHERLYRDFRYIYPVISRRAGGLSVGVNLSPRMECPFRCIYCQVKRDSRVPDSHSDALTIDLDRLEWELVQLTDRIISGEFWFMPPFDAVSQLHRRWNDIALSGDGEPLLSPQFSEVVQRIVQIHRRIGSKNGTGMGLGTTGLDRPKIVLITSAASAHLASAQDGLELLRACGSGEIWAKLDAGTEAYYRRVNRGAVAFEQVLENLREMAKRGPIAIQTLLVDGVSRRGWGGISLRMSEAEILAYTERLREITAVGTVDHVQIHTVAREPAEAMVLPVTREFRTYVATAVRAMTKLRVIVY